MKKAKNSKYYRYKIYFSFILMTMFLSSCTSSCASNYALNGQSSVLESPRESFVKIEKVLTVSGCSLDQERCGSTKFNSSASGAVVKNSFDGSYVLTAEHVCNDKYMKKLVQFPGVQKFDLIFTALDIDGNEYAVEIVSMDAPSDICLLWVEKLMKPELDISSDEPEPGDRLYNVAAPLGVWAPHMIPLQEGLYNGVVGNKALYSIPAVGGSSGSPVLNHDGELVGMIHSVYVRFANVSLGPTYDNLMNFLGDNINIHEKIRIIKLRVKAMEEMVDLKFIIDDSSFPPNK
jgi:S1-C subfamily serine protease